MLFGKIKRHIYKRLYTSSCWREKLIRQYMESHETVKLQIGCGPHPLPGWLNSDISYTPCRKGALYLDAGKPFPFPDHSIDFIFSEHVFEHLTYAQGRNMLQESFRVLKASGTIRIATPDFQFLANLYLHPEEPLHKSYIEWSAAGGGGSCAKLPATPLHIINKFHTAWGHQIIYDKDNLSALLEECGFRNIRSCEIGKSEVPALNNVESHFKHMPYEFYQLETMILEADKK